MIEVHHHDDADDSATPAPAPGFHLTINHRRTTHLKQLTGTTPASRKTLRRGAVVLVISVLLSLVSPLLIRQLVDQFARGIDWRLLVGIAVFMTVSTGLTAWGNYLFSAAGLRIVQDAQNQALVTLLAKPVAFFSATASGQLTSRLTNNMDQIKNYYTTGYPSLITGVVTILGAGGMLFYLNAPLTVILLAALLAMFGTLSGLMKALEAPMTAFLEETSRYSALVTEAFANIRLIKGNTAELQTTTAAEQRTGTMRQDGLQVARVLSRIQPILTTILLAILGGILALGAYFVATGQMTNGTLVSYLVLVVQVAAPMINFSSYLASRQQAESAAKNLLAELASAPEESSGQSALGDAFRVQPIRLHDVSLAYDDNGTGVQHLNLTLTPGRLYALVGPSGAGKSTLMALLERFYSPTEGQLTVGTTPAVDFSLTDWRRHIAYVPQASEVLRGTFRDYLRLAAPAADDDQLRKALAAVQLTDFLAALPQGLDSPITEAGTNMSGGQKQCLTIAQALLKDADIYLFDEITANLDADSENIIRKLMRQLAQTHTVLSAAHRLSSIRDADTVIMLENGRITGQGTPAALLASNPTYARFVAEQSLA